MGMPHRNYSPRAITGRPHNHNQSTSKIPRRDVPNLTIIMPVIRLAGVRPGENFISIGEVQPAIGKGNCPLGRIEGDLHRFIVVT
jgi:hypothetical protein